MISILWYRALKIQVCYIIIPLKKPSGPCNMGMYYMGFKVFVKNVFLLV